MPLSTNSNAGRRGLTGAGFGVAVDDADGVDADAADTAGAACGGAADGIGTGTGTGIRAATRGGAGGADGGCCGTGGRSAASSAIAAYKEGDEDRPASQNPALLVNGMLAIA
jgi:hypothetical protein